MDSSRINIPVIVEFQRQYRSEPRIEHFAPLRSLLHVRNGKAFLHIQASNL